MPPRRHLTHDLNDSHATLREAIRQRLEALPYPAYARLVREVILASGYNSVRMMKGTAPSGLPASHAPTPGGFDLVAATHTDLSTYLTAIQIKQGKTTVGRRFVDELRGAMLRLGAEQGLLVATRTFSSAAHGAAHTLGFLPMRLLDGKELAGLLLERGQGVCIRSLPKRPGEEVEWELDEGFFTRLLPGTSSPNDTKR